MTECEVQIPGVCTTAWGLNQHHRKLRRHGGSDEGENLITVCGSGTTGCHGWIHSHPTESYRRGWLVHSWDSPEEVPWRRHDDV